MVRRIVQLLLLTVSLAAVTSASANAVLLEGGDGTVVPTARQRIHTLVEAQVATTEVTTTFRTVSSDSALFCFGVPEQAAAFELVLILDGEEQVAEVGVGDQADYPEDMGNGDASDLAAYLGENPMRTWVSGIPEGAEVAFRLSYVELLPYDFGEVTYTFPLAPFDGDEDRIDRIAFVLELSTERPIEAFATSMADAVVTTHSDTQQSVTLVARNTYRNAAASVSYSVAQTELGLNLWAYRPPENPWVDEDDGYFLLLLEPPTESDEVSDKVFTYVLDRSGSMFGYKIIDARAAAITAVEGLNEGDHFNIIAFDSMLEFFAEIPQPATESNRTTAISFIEGIVPEGATAIHKALMAALDEGGASISGQIGGGLGNAPIEDEPSFAEPTGCIVRGGEVQSQGDDDDVNDAFEELFGDNDDDDESTGNDDDEPTGNDDDDEGPTDDDDDVPLGTVPRVMMFLTDGLPTSGITNPQTILADVDQANVNGTAIYSVAIGDDADEDFLEALASQNRGASVHIGANDDLQVQLEELFLRINNPLLVRPQLDLSGCDPYDVLPEELPDLFIGNQLVIVGRYVEPGTLDVELSGEIDGTLTRFDYSAELPKIEDANSFVGRIWAVTMVQHLLDRITAEGELPELVDQITQLGLDYGINTPYTPFSFDTGDDDHGDDDDACEGDDDDSYWDDDDAGGEYGDDDSYSDMGDDASASDAAGCSCAQPGVTSLDPAIVPMTILGLMMVLRGRSRRRG
jgi:hypothetical protein